MLIKLAWRNLWRNPIRTCSMLAAMIFGLLGVVTLMGFLSGMYANMVKNAIDWQTQHIQISHKAYLTHPDITQTIDKPESLVNFLTSSQEVQAYSARLIADGMLASARSTRGVKIIGVIPEQEAAVTPIASHITQGQWLSPKKKHRLVISQKLAKRLEARLGSKLVITFSDANGDVTGGAFRVSGIYQSPISGFDDSHIFVRHQDFAKLASIKGYHQVAIKLANTQYQDYHQLLLFKQQLEQQIHNTNSVRDWKQIQPLLASIVAQSGTSNLIILGIYVIAMCFGIINIMLMSVFERTQELGVLMAIGMEKIKILGLILFEASLLGAVGGLLGLLTCLGLMQVLSHTGIALGSMAEGLGAFGADTILYPQVSGGEYLFILITLIMSSTLAALYPAYQILKRQPVDAMAEKH